MSIVGIDYSLTSPGVSIIYLDDQSFQTSQHFYLTNVKKYIGTWNDNIYGCMHKTYNSEIERYQQIASWAANLLTEGDIVFIEDYSMASVGKTFHIAENTAILKYLLYLKGIQYITVPPTVIKKYAGKGNANKEQMYAYFLTKTGIDLKSQLGMTAKLSSPVTDIVDSFYIGLYGYDYIRQRQS